MFKTTTDSILSVFTKTIKALELHTANSYQKYGALSEQASQLQMQAAEHVREALKAKAASEKLKEFVNGPAS